MNTNEENTIENSCVEDDDDDDDDMDSAMYSADELFYSSCPTPTTHVDWRMELEAKQRASEGPLYEVPTVDATPVLLLTSYERFSEEEDERSTTSEITTSTISPLAVHVVPDSIELQAPQATETRQRLQGEQDARKSSPSNPSGSAISKKKSLWIACISTMIVTFGSGFGLGFAVHSHESNSHAKSASERGKNATFEHHLQEYPSPSASSNPETTWRHCATKNWIPIGSPISSLALGASLGEAVSLSYDGRTIAISIPPDGSTPAHIRALFFNGLEWVQVGSDIYVDSVLFQTTRHLVSISGDGTRILVGVAKSSMYELDGYARVFEFDGVDWNQLGGTIPLGEDNDYVMESFSVLISRDGQTCAITSPGIYDRGFVSTIKYNGSDWVQMGNVLRSQVPREGFGFALALSEDGLIIAVGAPFAAGSLEGNGAGKVYLFRFDDADWVPLAHPIVGLRSGGASVDISSLGDIVAVGSPLADAVGPRAGQVEVFHFNETDWIRVGHSINGLAAHDELGSSVSLSDDGTRIVVSSPSRIGDVESKRLVRAFQYIGNDWAEINLGIVEQSNTLGLTGFLSGDGNSILLGLHDGGENGELTCNLLLYEAPTCDSNHFVRRRLQTKAL